MLMHKVFAVNIACFKWNCLLRSWMSRYTLSGSWIFDLWTQISSSATVSLCIFELLWTLDSCLNYLNRYSVKPNCVLLYERTCAECDFVRIARVSDMPLLSLIADKREFSNIYEIQEPWTYSKLSGAILLHCPSKYLTTSIWNVGVFSLPIHFLGTLLS